MIGRGAARRFGGERNVLRRTTDRVESLLVFVLVFTFLAGAPLLAWQAGEASYRSDVRAREWERDHIFRVDAVLAENAGTFGPQGTASTLPLAARATWAAPNGAPRAGIVQVDPGARAGGRVQIWVDETGEQRAGPARRRPVSQAVLVGAAVVLCLAAGLTVLHRIGRALLDRGRDRAWTREWREVGPRWSGDRR
ncbi:Rv1733c family protein [Actinoplanes palleronii]|uniref:Integral membrane protein n=1 Tax=Actinoplanes palleronii TaxID=113570 RepID=A0ABQ4BCV5_9ACTN|nr:hypothetical protein [Actinoplanes palleronii]GIE68514.1 hypothetical protein Apa02nite_046220 [Actinoplanes palleronii]